MTRRYFFLLGGGIAVFSAALAVALFWYLGKAEQSARHASTQFAVALEHGEPSAAPAGAADFVEGVRAAFGPVTSARIIDAHNKGIDTGDSADTRSYFVADLLLRTERGAAVIELEFDNHSLNPTNETVSGVHELKPDDVPGGALKAHDLEQLASAFAARGGKPADLTGALAELPKPAELAAAPAPAADPAAEHDRREAKQQLRCVQNANGDARELQKCAEPR
jgi:hypothetical protein